MAGKSFWWKFGGPFGLSFAWSVPPFWGRFGSFPDVEEEIEMLEEYQKRLEEHRREIENELSEVKERIRRLRGKD
ncbi:MAG: hypothetical protein QHH75_14565 [Bacillota bacterium]|jgi:hypothetical protein|nr:hypothetical protein [Bacillota bacterium]